MSQRHVYQLTQVSHYDDIELHVVIGCFDSSEKEIERLAAQILCTILMEDGLHIVFGDEYFVISDEEKEKYQFQICIKKTPSRLDLNTLSDDEFNILSRDDRYMTTADDYQKVGWSLSKAYKELKKSNPDKKTFSFSSLAYGVDKIPNSQ